MPEGETFIKNWPDQSREAAQLVLDKYGQPDEASASYMVWHEPGPWKRMVAYKTYDEHNFPAPHIDSVESFLTCSVPAEKVSLLAQFDGSVVVNRTSGELSARCHDEEANFLALNLAHDIIHEYRTVQEARSYYATEFLAVRRGDAAPYMEGLHFEPAGGPDPDTRLLTDEELQAATAAGEEE